MWNPKYTITNHLASSMRKVGELIGKLNSKKISEVALVKMRANARILSSFSSTQIEGNPLPLTDVRKLLKTQPSQIKDTEREVLNYNEALVYLDSGTQKEKEVVTNEVICKIQELVVDGLIHKTHRGIYRQDPVFVNDPIKRTTIYLPPDAKDVNNLMSELVDFVNLNSNEIDPLIVAGLFHKQAVVIHPFMDGNGRTTRLITKMLLAKLGVDTFPLFSFENYYNSNISKYFKNVGVFGNYYDITTQIDFTQWLEYFTEGIIDELTRVLGQISIHQSRLKEYHKDILSYIGKNGSISTSEYFQITSRARATRIKDFKELIDLGLIFRVGRGKATYYVIREDDSPPNLST